VGMQRLPEEELKEALSLIKKESMLDNQTALRIKKKLAEEFRDQLTIGIPTNDDEAGLRRLARQIKNKKIRVKLFMRYPYMPSCIYCFALIRLIQPQAISEAVISPFQGFPTRGN